MASSGDRNWVDYLARALAQVGEAEKGYLEELAERRWQRERSERNFPSSFPLSDPARDLHSFYHHARYREGRYFEKRYAPLRHALQDLEHVLGRLISEDARAFIEILSVTHGVPIVSLMKIPHCIDRTASLLL